MERINANHCAERGRCFIGRQEYLRYRELSGPVLGNVRFRREEGAVCAVRRAEVAGVSIVQPQAKRERKGCSRNGKRLGVIKAVLT